MKLAYATTFDGRDISNWSGTPHYMSNALAEQGFAVEHIGSLKRKLPATFKLKQIWKQWTCDQRESPRFNTTAAKFYSEQVAMQLNKLNTQAVVAPQINPIAYLDCKQPIVLWTDALYASLIGFYPGFSNHSASSIAQGNQITAECLNRASLAIFSSDWAARSALELYGISQNKVKVVPFGANIQCQHTLVDIHAMLSKRSRDTIKFLFLGKHWHRKGGDIVFKVAKALHQAGHKIEVNFVGCYPPQDCEIPSYIICHGFISKRTPEGMAKITKLLQESHFLFVPSRAEAYGIVFCEASAFGLPSLTSYVGGIATVVKDDVNGKTFALDADPEVYCHYITNLMADYNQYQALALSSFHEYETRLNWAAATNKVKQLITEIMY
jgi:glycosyltransferase involved in cell wall biosynthesis